MKTHFFKRGIAGLLSLVMCLSAFIGLGTTTAFAAGEQAEVYLISFPRSGDANLDYSGTWGHSNLHYMNGWYSGESKYTTIRAMHSYDGNICYCIEPGTPQDTGDRYTSKDETFWDNLPSDFNSTISPYDMKLFIGRIMQYGYTGPISTSWRSQNASDAATLAQAMATQVLIWETVVGERDEDFNHISPGSYDAVKSVVSTAHPLYSQFISYYNSIEASVQRHSAIPSFMAKTPGKAQNVELAWNGTNYTATLTDSNNVLSNYSFSANEDGISFSVSGNKLVITAATAPSDSVRITASKSGATRRGIITWTDGRYAPGSGIQDVISYQQNNYTGEVPTLQDFRAELLKQSEPEAQEIALAIELFTNGSLNTFAKKTNVDTDNRLICYDILDLGKQLMPIGMLVVLDSILNRITQNRAKGKNTFIFIDEIYLLFQHEYSANFLFTLWKRVRKYGAYATGITQNVDDLLQSHTARTMLANSEFIVMLNQASTDRLELAKLLNISDTQLSYITNVDAGHGLIKVGSSLVPFANKFPKNTKLYKLMTTKPNEKF